MTIFPMISSKNHKCGSSPFFKPHSSNSSPQRVSLTSLYLLVLFNTLRNFLSEFSIIQSYFCTCLLVYCLSKLKPHKEQYNNFFIYHSLLYTSTATTNNSNNNNYNIIVLDLVLHGTSVFTQSRDTEDGVEDFLFLLF